MICDARLTFAESVTVTGAAATRNVGDQIPLTTINGQSRDIGNGRPVYFVVKIDAAPEDADTVKFQLVSGATASIPTNGTQTIHYATGDIPVANVEAGTFPVIVALPLEGPVYNNFLGFQVVNVGSSALAALQVTAFLTLDPPAWKPYEAALRFWDQLP